MLWWNNEDHKNDDTASTLVNDSCLQVNKRGGYLGYVIGSTNHLKLTKTALLSREATRLFKIGVKWLKNPAL